MKMSENKSLFKEFERHLMEDKKPSEYFNKIIEEICNRYPLNMLKDLKKAMQNPKFHPEGNAWIHTMMVVDNAASSKKLSKNPRAFMWAALLHDIGKGTTTKLRKGRWTSYNHDIEGEKLAIKFLNEFTNEENFIYNVSKLVRWHMQTLFVVKDLPFKSLEQMIKEVDIDEVALLSECDRLGRMGLDDEKIKEEKESIKKFISKAEEVLKVH